MRRPQAGVTLIELLIALAVFAVIGVAAYTALFAVLDARAATQARAERLAEVQFGVGRLADDLRQTVDRSAHAAQPAARRPVTTEPESQGDGAFALTRAGWANPADLPRSTLARVTWQLEEDRLLRHVRRSVDGGTNTEPLTRVVLEGVESIELRFRGAGDEWHERWPPLNRDATAGNLPRAVEVTLTLSDWGDIRRLFTLPASAPQVIPGGDGA